MADLVVIVPSRGRPEAAAELIRVFRETCTADTYLVFAVDEDDPTRIEYSKATGEEGPTRTLYTPSHTMVEALNYAARWVLQTSDDVFAIGFLGDDHRPRTVGWDTAYLDALREMGTGIVYGNDLLQGERLPTQCAMTADIVRALGFMAPPSLVHLAVDNFWLDLGHAASCIRYLPDVVVEHMHPVAGKAEWDEGHKRVNAPEMYQRDLTAYDTYRRTAMAGDVGKVRALLSSGGLARGGIYTGSGLAMVGESNGGCIVPPKPAPEQHEWRLFPEGTVPEYTRPEWYATREHAPHLEQQGHRERLMATASLVARAALYGRWRTVVDLGAGDGGLLSLLGTGLTGWGYDLMPANLGAAKARGVDVRFGDVVEGDVEWADIAVCTEMLEHLVDPESFLRRIAGHVRALVCSSPWQERPGSAYAYHTWAWDVEGYRALVERAGFVVKRQMYAGAFQIIMAVVP